MFDLSLINLFYIILGAFFIQAIGFLWYSKSLFGNLWQKVTGISQKDNDKVSQRVKNRNHMISTFTSLVISFLLFMIVSRGSLSFVEAFASVFLTVLFFVIPIAIPSYLYEMKDLRTFYIYYSYVIVSYGLLAGIFSLVI